jgi:hypothetical protein
MNNSSNKRSSKKSSTLDNLASLEDLPIGSCLDDRLYPSKIFNSEKKKSSKQVNLKSYEDNSGSFSQGYVLNSKKPLAIPLLTNKESLE